MLQGKPKSHPDMERALRGETGISYGEKKSKNMQFSDSEEMEPPRFTSNHKRATKPQNKNILKEYEPNNCGGPTTGVPTRLTKNNVRDYLGGVSENQIKEMPKMSSEQYSENKDSEQLLVNDYGEPITTTQYGAKSKIIDKNKQRKADSDERKLNEKKQKDNQKYEEFEGAWADPVQKAPTTKKNKKSSKNKKQNKDTKSSEATNFPNFAEYSAAEGTSSDEPTAAAYTGAETYEDDELPLKITSILTLPSEELLEPGIDVMINIKIYEPFDYEAYQKNPDSSLCNLFYHDLLLTGRNKISDIKDGFICNKKGPGSKGNTNNGFFFIKNGFYVDTEEASADYADDLRKWCVAHNFGDFPRYDMRACKMSDLEYKLGNPDVYIHDDSCEHILIFSQVRLMNANDHIYLSDYPRVTSVPHHHKTPLCYNCSGLNPKWIVSGCIRIPFNKALFCQDCLNKLLYGDDGQKICKFKASPYKGPATLEFSLF